MNARNLIIFGVSSSTRSTKRLCNIYMLGKNFDQGLYATTIYADKMFKTDPSVLGKMCVMNIHYNGTESYLFINGIEELNLQQLLIWKKVNFVWAILVISFQSKKCKKLVYMEMYMMCQLIIGHIVYLRFMTHTDI